MYVYIMPLLEYETCKNGLQNVYPTLRKEEIISCKSESVFIQKYSGWHLLRLALLHCTGKKITDFTFWKNAYGKWLSDGVNLSLTNTKSAVCAALSPLPVGVDMENVDEFEERLKGEKGERLIKEICHSDISYRSPIELWTKKESAYKLVGEGTFYIRNTDTKCAETRFVDLSFGSFCISLSGEGNKSAKFFEVKKDGKICAICDKT